MQTTKHHWHVQHCSVPGCMDNAVKTYAFGIHATSPVGLCHNHTYNDLLSARAKQRIEDDNLLRELGLLP